MPKNNRIAFLHLSDIHVSDFTEIHSGKLVLSRFSQYKKYGKVFIDDLDAFLQKENITLKGIIVTGDIANTGEKEDYAKVSQFFDDIVAKFSLEKDNLMMIPGNHDINWYLNEKAWREDNLSKSANEYHTEKFNNFKEFYNTFYNNPDFVFDPLKACTIVKPYSDYKLCFLGLNSIYKESFKGEDHYGYIDEKKLESELIEIKKKFKNYRFIAFWHHNPTTQKEKISISLKNWGDVFSILTKNEINNYFYGHTHDDESKKVVKRSEIGYFGIGSFGKKELPNSYSLFIEDKINDEVFKLKMLLFKFMPEESYENQDTGYWEKQDNFKGLDELNIAKETGYKPKNTVATTKSSIATPLNQPIISYENFYEDEDVNEQTNEEKIIEILKTQQIIKSGHFHWSNRRKTRTWLDINLLISSKQSLQIIRNEFKNILKNIELDFDLFIGLGIEGNILASPLAIVFNSYYTYYPLPTRNDHNEFEKRLITGEFKNIVLITDVIFEGSTVKEFIESNTEFFQKAENIILLSIFHTGKEEYSSTMFVESVDKRLNFHCLTAKIKLEKCTLDPNTCEICQRELDIIYKF